MKKLTLLIALIAIGLHVHAQSDGCTGVPALAVNSSCTTSAFAVNTDGTTQVTNASCATGTAYEDGWYSVVGTGGTMTITISGTSRDACLAAFSSCGGGSQLACQQVASGATTNNSISFAAANGTTYYIQIQRRSGNNSANLSGNICAVASAANDDCTGALAVSCGGTYSGSTTGASSANEGSLPGCGTSPSAAGVWYVYTGNGSTVTASLCSGTSFDTKINVYSGSGCGASLASCVTSNDDGCGTQSTVTFVTTTGTNYYILVNGFSGATGTFSLGITCCTPGVPTCATLNSPADAATGVAQCASLTWTAPATSGCTSVDSYDVYFGTVNPPPFYINTTSTSMPVGTSPSTVYYWQIRPKNSSGAAAGCTVRSFTSSATGNPQYTMVDDALSPSPYNCVSLTTATNDQRGCAWDMNSTLNFTSNFSYDFTVNLGSSDAGADGMAFVMQNDPQGRCKCGTAGGSLGAGGITKSVVVEIDTYLNTEDRDDFSSNFIGCSGSEDPDHLDIWFDGNINPSTDFSCDATGAGERPATPTAVRLTSGGSNYNIENGVNHILRIAWNAGTGTLTATVLNTALSATYGTISSTFNPLTVFGTNTPYFGFTASTGGLSNSQTFCNPAVLLPVELMSFHSYCFENHRKIYWSTASENNNAFFTLEKSLDGTHFEVLKIIAASGLKSSQSDYEALDNDRNSGTVYYRLSQTDYNGISKTFDVIVSECGNEKEEMTIETLVQQGNHLNIEYNALTENGHYLSLYDYTGRMVSETELSPDKGLNTQQILLGELSRGMYLVNLVSGDKKVTRRFYKE